MLTINWLYDITIIFYALSVLGYFIDFLQNNRKVNKLAFWLLSIVWLFQTGSLILSIIELGRFPILTPSEGLYFYSWILITFSLAINWLYRVDFFVFFTNVLGFMIMAIHLFSPKARVPEVITQKLMSELLVIHVTMAFLAYAAFTLSFVFSVMYWIQYGMLKDKKWGKRLQRFGNLSQLEKMSFIFNMHGVPLLLLSLILGTIWAKSEIEAFHYFDAKVIISFIVLSIYSLYLYLKVAGRQQGKALALFNNAAFLVVLINFFLSGSLSDFHLWR